jgi:hypothetical protein
MLLKYFQRHRFVGIFGIERQERSTGIDMNGKNLAVIVFNFGKLASARLPSSAVVRQPEPVTLKILSLSFQPSLPTIKRYYILCAGNYTIWVFSTKL